MAPRTPKDGQPSDGVPDLNCLHCGFGADATAPQTQDMGNAAGATDGIVAGDVCPNCNKAQLLTPAELQGKSSVPPPAVPQLPRT
jgi:Zn ribbon nucleic-acid-binding protein